MEPLPSTSEKFALLKANLERLLRSYQAIQRENDMLKEQIEAVRKSVQERNKKIESLEDQLNIQRTASSIASIPQLQDGLGDKEEVKKRINELIKEVDSCIALLNE
ncbi:MAG TPA: hypothetical protein PKL06_04370 [Chitinophagales bacterium]|nr:hypothetical protein [Chitinophagales bacterium]